MDYYGGSVGMNVAKECASQELMSGRETLTQRTSMELARAKAEVARLSELAALLAENPTTERIVTLLAGRY